MVIKNKKNILFLSISILVYGVLSIICWNHGYFWDNIQLTSIEAHWYYLTDFKTLIIPKYAPEYGIYGTGAPPLLPIITAILWKIIGYKLWVSHAFILLWAIILFYNTWKFIQHFFPVKYVGWISFIILTETTLLSQFSIAASDFILFTSLIISLRAIFEQKSVLLTIGLFFLFTISTRGIFTGSILFVVHCFFYYSSKKNFCERSFFRTFIPYFPAFVLILFYITDYLIVEGWFFSNSKFSKAQDLPIGLNFIVKHFCDFGMRLIENGRIIIWIIAIIIAWKTYKTKTKLTTEMIFILTYFSLLTCLYLSFVFLTKMPFLTRYFMPHLFLLSIFSLVGIIKFFNEKKIKFILILIFCFELTGHFWIYPEKVTKIWDSTLAHLPFYSLREECFDYIDKTNYNYNEISAGFCLYDDRRFVELKNADKIVGRDKDRLYFIYSNISNVPDEWVDEFKNSNRWIPIKNFSKGFVYITIYKNIRFKEKAKQ
jgi:hypothetical protein